MKSVFSNSAVLEMNVKTDNIAFPNKTEGVDLITDVLVKKFNADYENIYTFCLSDSVKQKVDITDKTEFNWLVGMTTKANGELRIGHGVYQWEFDKELPLINNLIITIDEMVILKPQHTSLVMSWLNELPYPWCDKSKISNTMPQLEELTSINKAFK